METTSQVYKEDLPIYYRPEDYINRAQILLNRFFDYNPQFKATEFSPYHSNLMLSALALAHKVSEENSMWNGEIAKIIAATSKSFPPRRIDITRDIIAMERLFLNGIDWNTTTQVPIELDMISLLYEGGTKKSDEEAAELLTGKDKGDYLIRTKDDHYILAIKSADDKIQFHEFTFDADKNAVEILSPATEKEPMLFYELSQLISAWGGLNLIRNQPQKRTA